jgi:hypothetical protein
MPKSLDFLDTNGGHIVVCLLLLVVGAAFCVLKIPKGEDVIVAAMAILARSMMGGKSADLPDPELTVRTTSSTVDTVTEPESSPVKK